MFGIETNLLITLIAIVFVALLLFISISLMFRKSRRNQCISKVDLLERKKNSITNIQIAHELSKLAIIARNEELNKKYSDWQERWKQIATKDLSKISDDILFLDDLIDNYKIRSFKEQFDEISIYIDETLEKTQTLLNEIREVTLNEEQHRLVITDLKSKFREIKHAFNTSHDKLGQFVELLQLRFELISDRMQEFDFAMENNDYIEVEKIADHINEQIRILEFAITKLPNIILLLENVIPKRINEMQIIYSRLVGEGLPLVHLELDQNLNDAMKTMQNIEDRIHLLDLEDSELEMKAIIEFCDLMLKEFERERGSKEVYLELLPKLNQRLESLGNLIEMAQSETVQVSLSYNLEQVDEVDINDLLKDLDAITAKYNVVLSKEENGITPYSEMKRELEFLLEKVLQSETRLNTYMEIIAGMREDENRAREQINEMRLLMREIKYRIRSGRLPLIPNVFIIQLEDANEAIKTILDELEKTPIDVDVLNTRVDTARDLVFKLFNTTNELIKTSYMVERAILYGNRYRSSEPTLHKGLGAAEKSFFEGNYSEALNTAINVLERVEPGIYKRLMELYDSVKPKVTV